jgi:hypothetical protein
MNYSRKREKIFNFIFTATLMQFYLNRYPFGFNGNFQDLINEVMGNKLTYGSQYR